MVKEFTPIFTEEDLVNLPKYEFYIKLMIDGIASDPFSARGLPPLTVEQRTNNIEKVVKVSRERYAKERNLVEDKINRWHSNTDEEGSKESGDRNKERKNVRDNDFNARSAQRPDSRTLDKINNNEKKASTNKKIIARCARCGKDTEINFIPDGIRPIYCKDCLQTTRNAKQAEIEDRKKKKEEELKRLDLQEAKNNETVVAKVNDEEDDIREGEEIKF